MARRETASAIVIDTNGNFLLQHRDDNPAIMFPGAIGLFGGHREGDETFPSCAVRELREELSYPFSLRDIDPLCVYAGPDIEIPGGTLEYHIFVVRNVRKDLIAVTEGTLAVITPADLHKELRTFAPAAKLAFAEYLRVTAPI